MSVYTPQATRQYESKVARVAIEAMQGKEVYAGAVSLIITVAKKTPEGWSKKKKQMAYDGLIHATTKPDLDNYDKIIDALNGIVFKDDNQVVRKYSEKRYAEEPYLSIEVNSL